MTTIGLILFVLFFSVVLGILVGLLPGLPGVIGLLLFLPMLSGLPPELAVLFFCCCICVTQYFGSVSALLFRIPGEASSLPALHVASQLKQATSVIKAYRVSAFTSLVASLTALSLLIIVYLVFRQYWAFIFSIKFILVWIIMLLVVLIMQNKNYIFNTAMIVLGICLSHANEIPALNTLCNWQTSFCFLRTGTDATLILLSLFCLPIIFIKNTIPLSGQLFTEKSYLPGWRTVVPFWKKGITHGLLGFVTGFTPGAGMTLASNLSGGIARKQNSKKLLTVIGSAEASNNSAAISCAIPFLFMGLPINASELVLENYLSSQFIRWDLQFLPNAFLGNQFGISFFTVLIGSLLICNLLCFFASGHGINFYRRLLATNSGYFLAMAKLFIVGSLIFLIYQTSLGWNTALFTVVFFGSIGHWAMSTGRDITGLAIALVLGHFIIEKFDMARHLYF
jgi:putative tricarboxylic transport membrane protein